MSLASGTTLGPYDRLSFAARNLRRLSRRHCRRQRPSQRLCGHYVASGGDPVKYAITSAEADAEDLRVVSRTIANPP